MYVIYVFAYVTPELCLEELAAVSECGNPWDFSKSIATLILKYEMAYVGLISVARTLQDKECIG